ncbi:hypothetical protein [Flavobacterium sp. N1736]|uniref:hypothetical protein n=1 Tax=Flavobacterium sp. N1736 TaxID=2986823 RepID=UPI0022243F9B|nr:hypothetical protein [Flavobacterium sp. N1736]
MKKKLFYYLPLLLLVLSSCSGEDYVDNKNIVLPKTLKIIYPYNTSANFDTEIVYDANKIASISNKYRKREYVYNGTQIIKEIEYNLEYDQGKSEKAYTYINDSLKTVTTVVHGQKTRYVYVYNIDGTVTIETYILDKETAKESKESESKVLTFNNGNLIKSVFNSTYGERSSTSRYDYDANNNAFKNVLGLDLLLDQANFGSELNLFSKNNIKKYSAFTIGSGIVSEPYFETINYEYNKNGYPAKKTTYNYKGDITEIIEYIY